MRKTFRVLISQENYDRPFSHLIDYEVTNEEMDFICQQAKDGVSFLDEIPALAELNQRIVDEVRQKEKMRRGKYNLLENLLLEEQEVRVNIAIYRCCCRCE